MAELLRVVIDDLMPDPAQPRKSFLKDEIERLAASIRARGVLLPLRVLWDAEREKWRIVTGECRWRAARLAGLTHVPCLPVDGEISETDILSDQVIENTVRNSFKPLELARAIARLKALKGCTAKKLAEELGISGAEITRTASLLTLPDDIQSLIDAGSVPEGTAYEISRLPDEQGQRVLATAVAAKRLNRDEVAEAVRNQIGRKKARNGGRVICRVGGISFSISGTDALDWAKLIDAIDRIRRKARKLSDDGADIAALGRSLREP